MGLHEECGYTPPMVTAFIFLFAALWISGFYLLVVATRRAPVGFEDADGFHVVEQQSKADAALGAAVSAS